MKLRGLLRPACRALLALLVSSSLHAAEPARSPAWTSLSAEQRQALAPLQRDWGSIDEQRKQKWLEVATRFPSMADDERARVRERMTEWARMTPAERGRARMQFQEVQKVPAAQRQALWKAYLSLSPEERVSLAQRAKPPARAASGAVAAVPSLPALPAVGKRNVVQAPAAPNPRAVSPTSMQVKPGATTTTMSTKASPPVHHQTGLPKIAAMPGFVDPATLLPQRGPQGAAVRSAAGSGAPAAP